jgi:hypothetical protein
VLVAVAADGSPLSIDSQAIDVFSWGDDAPNGNSQVTTTFGQTYQYQLDPNNEGSSWTQSTQYLQGCSGPGIPCSLQGTGHGTWNALEGRWGYAYNYTLVDVNGDKVYGALVSEFLQDVDSPDSWYQNPGMSTFVESVFGSFTDFVGFSLGPSSMFDVNQRFMANLGGVNYLLTTQNSMFAVFGGPGIVYASVRNTSP